MIIGGEKTKYSTKSCPSTTNLVCPDVGINPGKKKGKDRD
jgi:hypothetical protein